MLLGARPAAALLGVSERQIYRWVTAEEIPFQRVHDQPRFNRTDLLEWATARRLPISIEAFDESQDPEDRCPSLARALRAGRVHPQVPAVDRDSALRALVERIPLPAASLDRELVVEVLIARESPVSTAVAEGIAIPHVRHPIVAPGAPVTASVAYLAAPVSFGGPGDEPVHTLVLIVSPTVRTHLQMVAHLARALLDAEFRAALGRHAPTEELAALAARLDAPSAPRPPAPRQESD